MIITLYKEGKDGRTQYYTVHDRQPVLDAPYSLCASWRVGSGREREKLHRFQTLLERDKMIRRLIAMRVKKGYTILYTFARDGVSVGKDPAVATGDGARQGRTATGGAKR
jgi:predicted DNA-binding WGR domain protein